MTEKIDKSEETEKKIYMEFWASEMPSTEIIPRIV